MKKYTKLPLKKALNPLGGRMAKRAAMRRGFNDNSSAKHYDRIRINRMYSRNVLNKVTDADEPTWKISDFYSRYSYYAQFEYYEFGCLPRELIEALYDWQTEIYQSIYLPQVKAKVAGEGVYVHNQTYLTLEEFDKIIDGHHGSIHLVPCNCKSQKYFHDRKLNVCVNMNDGPNSAVDRGMGEPISPEDMKKKVRESTPADSCRTARTASSATATVCAASRCRWPIRPAPA